MTEKKGLWLTIRYDDSCGNGYNSFSLTGELKSRRGLVMCGSMHDEIAQIEVLYSGLSETNKGYRGIKEYCGAAELKKWHLCSSDGPMHYTANTLYWVKEGNLENARSSAIWKDATLEELGDEKLLMDRLPALMKEFKMAMEALGFVY